ncbi:flagellar filament capping protein FliD [Yoonia vestfoldensis]|jgi:flagellar hook-associated protein 2|uniref:Flagellar hook-associated protein 2 n=1 Tax=Yoonia vestfoldensis TaxID=245188 RepID=A0A1Y0EGJ5_9RHOB|nr:flagellar filament capping protein FliD [Yoonia vestfoldensis]ARU02753.1 flagellar hook-associated protein 2 [Yoonia vestfoldensis]
MAEIKPDILSTVSRGGSGIEIRQLVTSLVAAETSGERSLNQRRLDDTNTTISAMGQLSQQVGTFKDAMAAVAQAASRQASSSTNAITFEVTNAALASDVSASVSVEQLASEQVLSFRFDASVTPTSAVKQGAVALNTDAWDDDRNFTIDASNDTLSGLTKQLNAIDGVTASLLDTGTGYALIVKSRAGESNALDADSITAIKTALNIADGAADGVTDATNNPLGVSSTVVAAQDALLLVDGVTVQRSENTFEDLFPGHKVTLNAVGTSTLASADTSTSVQERINSFLTIANDLKSYLTEATQRGLNGAEPGPLAGDVAAQSVLSRIRNIATQPINGFGAEPVFLAQIGIQTERDGTLTLNSARFERAMAENPDIVDALFSTKYSSNDPDVTVTGLSFAPPKVGSYALVYDPSTSPATATLDGQALSVTTNSAGKIVLRASEGDANGLQIVLGSNESLTTTVRYGQSMADQLKTYGETLLGASGIIARRETELSNNLAGFETNLEDIETKAAALTERYNIRFGRMEAVITSLNKTGEYMQSLMDAWNADR